MWIYCEVCGKKLIRKLPGGLYEFKFGKKDEEDGRPPVMMLVQGNIKMNCLRRGCDHETILNQFPLVEDNNKK